LVNASFKWGTATSKEEVVTEKKEEDNVKYETELALKG